MTRCDYLTAYANRELYTIDASEPESGGRLGIAVRLLGCVKPSGWRYGPSHLEWGDVAHVEYVTGPAIGLRFEILAEKLDRVEV